MLSRPFSSTKERAEADSAFTLVELLMVVAVMMILLSLSVPLASQVFMANRITLGAQTVANQLNLARQTALTRNRVVETRFYQFTSSEDVDKTPEIKAVQNFIYDESNTSSSALDEIHYLQDGTMVSPDAAYSSIIQASREKTNWTNGDSKPPLPRDIGINYTTYTVRFRPDGSTDLGAGSWFATVRSSNGASNQMSNYATVHIDPYNGSLRLYRPDL